MCSSNQSFHLHELSLLLPSFSFYVHVLACVLCFFSFGILVPFTFAIPLCFFFISSCCFDSIDNTWIFHVSLGFGTHLGEFLNIEPWSNSIKKCLSHIQLKLIPKNVKNHSYCAIGIISPWLLEEQTKRECWCWVKICHQHKHLDHHD